MKSVAIVGFAAETFDGVHTTQADEIWTLCHGGFLLDLPHVERMFEIHPMDFIFHPAQYSSEYWEYLATPHPYPIYVQELDPRVVSGVKYPLDEICDNLFKRFFRGDEINRYFTCSLSYMMALAIHEKFDRIEFYGVEMGTMTEYRYQKPGGEFMTGVAVGRGIEVVLPENTKLCHGLLYGYEAIHMITRQSLEAWRRAYQKEFSEALSHANVIAGKLADLKKHVNESSPEFVELSNQAQKAQAQVFAYNGAVQAVEKLMLECDMVPEDSKIMLKVEATEVK